MSDVTRFLDAAVAGDRKAAADLLSLVYDELRQLVAARMAAEPPDQALQPTALVHEAYLRLIRPAKERRWENRGHFFAAAADAMRRILVDAARRKRSHKDGGHRRRVEREQVGGSLAGSGPPRPSAYRNSANLLWSHRPRCVGPKRTDEPLDWPYTCGENSSGLWPLFQELNRWHAKSGERSPSKTMWGTGRSSAT
jgi:hypothetical protein